ncbi:hypothetical protein Peur_009582 [Populus x canadensis]
MLSLCNQSPIRPRQGIRPRWFDSLGSIDTCTVNCHSRDEKAFTQRVTRIPALVPGHRAPVHPACNAPANSGGSSTGNHGKESSRKRGPKRRAIYILGKQQEMQSFKTKDETG